MKFIYRPTISVNRAKCMSYHMGINECVCVCVCVACKLVCMCVCVCEW